MSNRSPALAAGVAALLLASSCGGGVPLRVRIDEAAFPLDLSELVAGAQSTFLSTGVLPARTTSCTCAPLRSRVRSSRSYGPPSSAATP